MREVAPFVLLTCACGAAVSRREAPRRTHQSYAAAAHDTAVPGPFDDLTALGPSVAPGMREIARKATAGEAIDLVRAVESDACVRVAFAASSPVVVKLVDETGDVLASGHGAADAGVLAERGPVCIRKGEVIRAVTEGSAAKVAQVRWVAWQAP